MEADMTFGAQLLTNDPDICCEFLMDATSVHATRLSNLTRIALIAG